jgi:hypothetical protein
MIQRIIIVNKQLLKLGFSFEQIQEFWSESITIAKERKCQK